MLRSTRQLNHYQLLIFFCFNTLLSLANGIPTDTPLTPKILYYHHASTANLTTRGLSKSRLMSNCPPLSTYIGSACATDQSLQAVKVGCQTATDVNLHLYEDTCDRNEICTDVETTGSEESEAYCVADAAWGAARKGSDRPGMRNLLTAEAWVKVAVPKEGEEPVPIRYAQARLVGRDTPTRLIADYIVLVAYREETVEDAPVRRVTGSEDCKSCYDVTMSPVPEGTSLLRAMVIVPPHVEALGGATLYLFTVE